MELVPMHQYSCEVTGVFSTDYGYSNGLKCSISSTTETETVPFHTSDLNLTIAMFQGNNPAETRSSASVKAVLHQDVEKGTDLLRKVFDVFDKDRDGKLSYEELNQSFQNLGLSTTGHGQMTTLHHADSNCDGFVDFDEFATFYHDLYGGKCGNEGIPSQQPAHNSEDLMAAFQVFDKNGDGFISAPELQSVLTALGLAEGRKLIDCQNMINNVDSDGDGVVNLNEFEKMMLHGV
eukprot:c20739_g1_i1 orf=241-945(+)